MYDKYQQLQLLTITDAAEPQPTPELLCQLPLGQGLDKLPGTIRADAAGYERKFGQPPTVAWVHPSQIDGAVEGLELRAREAPYVGWFWLGRVE